MTAAASPASWPPLVAVVSKVAVVVGTDSEVIGPVFWGVVVTIEGAVSAEPVVVGCTGELDIDGNGLGAVLAADVVTGAVASGFEVPAVSSPESWVSRMIAVVAPATTSTAKIASSTLRVVLLGGGSSGAGP